MPSNTPFEVWNDTDNHGASVLCHVKEFGDGWRLACPDDLGLSDGNINQLSDGRCAAIFSSDNDWKYAIYSHRKNWVLAVNAIRAHSDSDGFKPLHVLIIGNNVNELAASIYKSIPINTVVV